jgi:hypothetical protein
MARVRIHNPQTLPTEGTPRAGSTDVQAVFNQHADSLHLRVHRLGAGAALGIVAGLSDCVAYIWKGAAAVGDTVLAERASVIVEREAVVSLTAASQGASVLVFTLNGVPARTRAGGHVHLLPAERVPRTADMGGLGLAGGALHADAACPTCEVWLHENDFYQADYEVPVHSHTEDEIIFVRAGSVRLGNRLYGPGSALAIKAHTKYGFRAGPEGLSFVNFRASSPSHVSADGAHVMDEAKLWRDHVGAPRYLEPATG